MSSNWFEKAPRLGTEEDFAAMRKGLGEAGFDEANLLARLQLEDMKDHRTPSWEEVAQRPVEDALSALIRLFCDSMYVEQSQLARFLSGEFLAAMEALDLLADRTPGEERRYATAAILPVGPLLTICDRRNGPDLMPFRMPADAVYPATTENSREFQKSLPQTPCDALLDLGTGTGIAALAAAGQAKHVWGADITPRSVLFAEFNRRLNGIENATMVEGDLYEAVKGLTFDRIVAHPPYVPARKDTMIFRDAGEDGEQILRRVVEGLPEFLRPGGRLYLMVRAADCEGQPFEDRLRLWLGAAADEYDLVLVAYTLSAPNELVATMIANRNTPLDEVLYRQELWARRKVLYLFHGTVLIRRHAEERPALTVRVQKGVGLRPEHADWLLDWHTAAADPAFLLACHAAISPDAKMAVIHHVRQGRLVPATFSLRAGRPFDSQCMVPGWLAKVVGLCDGRRSWQEVLDAASHAGIVEESTSGEEFAAVLAALGGNGLLHVAEMPLES